MLILLTSLFFHGPQLARQVNITDPVGYAKPALADFAQQDEILTGQQGFGGMSLLVMDS